MALTPPTPEQLASFMGIEVSDLDPYATEALSQAADLLLMGTGLTTDPTDETQLRFAVRGMAAMAELVITGLDNRTVVAGPFIKEHIGSYSYELAWSKIDKGLPTGCLWFDLAIRFLTAPDSFSSSTSLFENEDGLNFTDASGQSYVLGPADQVTVFGRPD